MEFRRTYTAEGTRINLNEISAKPTSYKIPVNNAVISDKYLQKKNAVLPSPAQIKDVLYPKDTVLKLNSTSTDKGVSPMSCNLDKKALTMRLSANVGLEKWFHDDKKQVNTFPSDPLTFIQNDLDSLRNEMNLNLL